MGFAGAVVQKVGLHPIGLAEIEMATMGGFQQAGGTQIGIVADRIDIGPERRCVGRRGIAGQIGAACDEGWGEAEVKAEQGRCLARRCDQPVSDRLARPDAARRLDQFRRILTDAADGDRYPLVSCALGAGPVDRGEAREPGRHAAPRSARSLFQ
jgi:hypothetical protein